MASFQIFNDEENKKNGNLIKKEFAPFQKRNVLGSVNFNIKDGKSGELQAENGVTKKMHGRPLCEVPFKNNQFLSNGPPMNKATNFVTAFPINKVSKSTELEIFQDDEVDGALIKTSKSNVVLRNENKVRVLKDKNVVNNEKEEKPIQFNNVADLGDVEPIYSKQHEPMSEADDSLLSADSMDISMASIKGDLRLLETQPTSTIRDIYICEEYRTDISVYLRSLQLQHRPKKNYMSKQSDISHNMRAILVDWLVEVTEEYNMTNETLFLAVNYIDRFLSQMSCIRSKLQLVGTAAMFIASKYEEIYPPDVKDFVYITDDTYTKSQVLRMEHLILRVLRFDVSGPTALWFLSDFLTHYSVPENVKYLAMYLCELTLMEADPYLGFLPSEIATSAICLARYTLLYPTEEIYPSELQKVVDIHLEDIIHVISAMDRTFRNADACAQQAIREKYKGEKFHGASLIGPLNEDCHIILAREYDFVQK